jgi:hypothetical protein
MRGVQDGEISVEALERRLQVRARAKADGRGERPDSDAHEPDGAETEIQSSLSALRESAIAERVSIIDAGRREIAGLTPSTSEVPAHLARHGLDDSAIITRAEGERARLARDAARAEADLESFRRSNNLRRPAIYPRSTILAAALLAAAATFEAVFSAGLFAKTSDQGLLGGAAIATGLGAANVALAVGGGYFGLRYLQHVRLPWRIAGASIFVVLLLGAIGLNLYAAGLREQMARPEQLIEARRIDQMLAKKQIEPIGDASASFLGLAAPEAVLLLMLAAGVFIFAALKGYRDLDDPYPDYGKLDRAAAAAREALDEAESEVRAARGQAVQAAQARIEADLTALKEREQAMLTAYDKLAARISLLDARIRALDATGASLIQLYRRENAAQRRTPPPAYFTRSVHDPAPLGDGLAAASETLGEGRAAIAALRRDAASAMDTLRARLARADADEA